VKKLLSAKRLRQPDGDILAGLGEHAQRKRPLERTGECNDSGVKMEYSYQSFLTAITTLLISGLSFVCFLYAFGASSDPIQFKISGTLSFQQFVDANSPGPTSTRSFSVVKYGDKICVEVNNNNTNGEKILRWRFLVDTTNSYRITEHAPPSGKMIRVYAGPDHYKDVLDTTLSNRIIGVNVIVAPWTVPSVDSSGLAPVWLAFCSGNYFQSRKKSVIDPIVIDTDRVRALNLHAPASWTLVTNGSGTAFPKTVTYFTDGHAYSLVNDEFFSSKMSPPYDVPTTNAVFKVIAWTNVSGAVFPRIFQLMHYAPKQAGFGSNDLRLIEVFEGTATNFSLTASNSDVALNIPQLTHVIDERFSRDVPPIYHLTYDTTNGLIPAMENVRQIPRYADAYKDAVVLANASKRRFFFYWCFSILAILPLAVFFLRRKSGRADGSV
jgi:hypothetical protein